MQSAAKRRIEVEHGKALLAGLGLEATISSGVEPAPDMLFERFGKVIGLEHTGIFAEDGSNPGAFQAYEKLIDRIAEELQSEYVKRGLPPVEVKLSIGRLRIKKSTLTGLVSAIVDAVVRNLPSEDGSVSLDNDWEGDLPAEVNSIRMIRFPALTSASFFITRSAWIMSIGPDLLQAKIDEKAKRLSGYLSACEEVWLLIVEERTMLSNTFEISEELLDHTFEFDGFARVFFKRGRSGIHELKRKP